MPWLTIIRNGEEQESFPVEGDVDSGEIPFITIGSDPGNAICLRDEGVESFHAILSAEDGRFNITDQGTEAGVFRNGDLVEEEKLEGGDHLIIGTVELVFHTENEVLKTQANRKPFLVAAILLASSMAGGAFWYYQHIDEKENHAATVAGGQNEPESPAPLTEPTGFEPIPAEDGKPVTEVQAAPEADTHPAVPADSVPMAPAQAMPAEVAAKPEPVFNPPVSDPDAPALSGPAELFPAWEVGDEFRYYQEETKRTESPSETATLKVISEAIVRVEDKTFNSRNSSTGTVRKRTMRHAGVSWPKLRIERSTPGSMIVFDSSETGDSVGPLPAFGRGIMSDTGAGVVIDESGKPFFVRSSMYSMSGVSSPGESWWDVPGQRRASQIPARLVVLPPLAWRLPLGEQTAVGATWSDGVRINLHEEMFETFLVNADYHFEKYEGPLALISVDGNVAPDSLHSGLDLKSSEVKGTIRIDPVHRVLAKYDVTISLEATGEGDAPLRLEQRLVTFLLNPKKPSTDEPEKTTADPGEAMPPAPDVTATPDPTPPSNPETPAIPELAERLKRFQEVRAEKVAQLTGNLRNALKREIQRAGNAGASEQRDAAVAASQALDGWIVKVGKATTAAEVLPLPDLPESPEDASPELVKLRGILETELEKIEGELGDSLGLSLESLAAQLSGMEKSSEAEAVTAWLEALRKAHPDSFGYPDAFGDSGGQSPTTTLAENSYRDARGNEVVLKLGELAFADESISNDFGTQEPISYARNPDEALGPPNHDPARNGTVHCLGCGGHGIWRFVDNTLTDGPGDDLHIFEVGPAVEAMLVSISTDGRRWIEIGRVEGRSTSIDIGGRRVRPGEEFRYVRLTDLKTNCAGRTPGADIDAIAAIHGNPVR